MKHVYDGKTKSVFLLNNGNYLLKFKDDVTGTNGKFDPGANSVGLSISGMGQTCVRLTDFFFNKIESEGIATHYVSANVDEASMEVKAATPFGHGLEVICRLKAVGSFFKRYGEYVKEGQALDYFVEFTLKDNEREDPPITKDALAMLGILTPDEYEELKSLTKKITKIVKTLLLEKNIELYDIKLEFGRHNKKIILMDEISGGNMRAYKNGKYIEPLDLPKILF